MADFVKKTWACGDSITADELNRLEGGVEEALDCCGSGDAGYSCTETYETVFDGSITTELLPGAPPSAEAEGGWTPNFNAEGRDAKITFNGTEYNCPWTDDPDTGNIGWGAMYDSETDAMDWSVYPFFLFTDGESGNLVTQTAGTYQVKIEVLGETVEVSECFTKAVSKVMAPPLIVETESIYDNVTSTTTYRLLTPSTEIYEAKQNGRSVIVHASNDYCDVISAKHMLGCSGGSYFFTVCVHNEALGTTEFWHFDSRGTNEYAEYTPTV